MIYGDYNFYDAPKVFPSAPPQDVLAYPDYHGSPQQPPVNPIYDLDAGGQQPLYPLILPPQPRLTQAIHAKTLELLSKANEQAAKILDHKFVPPPPYNPQVISPVVQQQQPLVVPVSQPSYHIDLSDRSWKMFNSETHVHHHSEGEKKGEKDDTGLRILVGVVGLIGALAAIFFVGKAVASNEDAQEETESFDELKTQWNAKQYLYDDNYQSIVNKIVGKMESIFKRNETDRTHKIALLFFAGIAGGSAFVGALAASKVLMAAGVIIGACTAAAALYRLGYSLVSKREAKDAEAIEKALFELNTLPPLAVYP